jgi:hypothetical protein
VTLVPLPESTVNVPSPFAVTVPTTAGLAPPNGGRPLEEPELGGAHVPERAVVLEEEVDAPATLPPATTSPNATAAALMTRTPLRRLLLISGYGSNTVSMLPSFD